jgi:hypothetical protein
MWAIYCKDRNGATLQTLPFGPRLPPFGRVRLLGPGGLREQPPGPFFMAGGHIAAGSKEPFSRHHFNLSLVGIILTLAMSSDRKTNEWNLLKEQFEALVRNENAGEDGLTMHFDDEVCRRFGEFISWAMQDKTKGYYRATWPRGGRGKS